jgi:hypothetical protein
VLPGTTDADPVAEISTSAEGTSASVAVALLFPAGSLVPTGAATVAVFAIVPVALAEMVPVAVKVTVPPLSTFTLAARSPLPLAAGQAEPALAEQVQVTPVSVAGKMSVTVAPVTALGPALPTVMTYVAVAPGTGVPELSAFVMLRSDVGVMTVLASVAELLPAGRWCRPGGDRRGVRDRARSARRRGDREGRRPPERRFTEAARFPTRSPGRPSPRSRRRSRSRSVTLAGKMSVTVAPVTADGPAFDATMV